MPQSMAEFTNTEHWYLGPKYILKVLSPFRKIIIYWYIPGTLSTLLVLGTGT